MTVLAHPAHEFRPRRRTFVRSAAVVVFWAIAALLVFETDRFLAPRSLMVASAGKVAAILTAGWAFIRVTAREATVDDALAVGIAWYVLAIAAEIAITMKAMAGAGWFVLIGPPDAMLLRAVLFATWVGGPALFARHSASKGNSPS